MSVLTYRESIAIAMKSALKKNPDSLVYGICVTDHTGIFGTTLGLEAEFGSDRVFETPLSEDAMTGFAVGAALNGLYPIHIHMRNDFLLLSMNQLVNSIAKYKYMYGGCFETPMLVRGIIGRSWGQGAQHSQSLQALFAHIPGLTVIMPASAKSVLGNYDYVVNKYRSPIISIEHRLLYDYVFESDECVNKSEALTSYLIQDGSDVTIIAVSIMVQEAKKAGMFVKDSNGIEVEIIDLNCITNPDIKMILESVSKTGKVIVADTGWSSFGVCAEIARIIATKSPEILKAPIIEISMAKTPCPTAKTLEDFFYPDIGNIVDAIYSLHYGKAGHGKSLPSEEHKLRSFKEFKGPF
jgi:pyruvate dehydrogenase E1 component beta subunit|tara:strand:+ start:1537 stop:2595 length:1059 start_codon:yes stop_codon:yes gene_type:complete